ncbi:MAG: GntR family transcriptional regulator [Candidatus Acidiferrales bacterium]
MPTRQNLESEETKASSNGIPRLSLASAVADKLRAMIIRGDVQEGEQLRQDAIATDFQVSRIPVREALRQLEAEGLIKIVAHRGAVVSALSADEIEELFDIRALLECEVLKVSIPNLTDADFEKADSILGTYEKALWMKEEVGTWGRLNWQFHATLYSRANRPHFMSIIKMINNNGDRYTRLQLYLTQAFERAKKEHRMLLDLCQKRDAAAASDLLERHIHNAGRMLKEFVKQHRK